MHGLIACRKRWSISILALDSAPITTARICFADGYCHCSANPRKPCPICRRRLRLSRTHGKRTCFLRMLTLSSGAQRRKRSKERGQRRQRRWLVEAEELRRDRRPRLSGTTWISILEKPALRSQTASAECGAFPLDSRG